MATETLAAWLDLTVQDAERSRSFYAEILGVSTTAVGMHDARGAYSDHCLHAVSEGPALGGICHARGANTALPAMWIPYFAVARLDEALARATTLGATIIDGPRSCTASQRMAFVRDLDGAVFALVGA